MTETYQLKHPITIKKRVAGGSEMEEIIDEVSVRRVKAKDLQLLDKVSGKFAQTFALIGALTGLSPIHVGELDGEDIEGLGDIIGDFFPGRQETGAMSSET